MPGRWIKKVPLPTHECEMPETRFRRFDAGSIWQCTDCQRTWMFVSGDAGTRFDLWDEVFLT